MKTFNQFIAEHPELQDMDAMDQQFFYDSYLEDYRFGLDRLSEDPDPYGDND